MAARPNEGKMDSNTTITFRCPKDLADKIRRAALDDNRTLSNWITNALAKKLGRG